MEFDISYLATPAERRSAKIALVHFYRGRGAINSRKSSDSENTLTTPRILSQRPFATTHFTTTPQLPQNSYKVRPITVIMAAPTALQRQPEEVAQAATVPVPAAG